MSVRRSRRVGWDWRDFLRSSISWPREETPVSSSLLMSVGMGMSSGGIREILRAEVSAAGAMAMDKRRRAQNLSMAFESREEGFRQGIFRMSERVVGVWSKIAKKFTVSLPRLPGAGKKLLGFSRIWSDLLGWARIRGGYGWIWLDWV